MKMNGRDLNFSRQTKHNDWIVRVAIPFCLERVFVDYRERSWTVQVPISRLFGMWVLDRRVLGSRRLGMSHTQHSNGWPQTVPRLLRDDGRRVRRRNTNGPQVALASPNAGELWLEQIGLRPIRPRAL